MSDRISFGQVALAAGYASPLIARPMVAASNNWLVGVSPARLIRPFIVGTVLLCIPAVLSNVIARSLGCWMGGGLSGTTFHLAVGALAGAMLVSIVDLVSRGTAQIGGGLLGLQALFALVLAGLCNATMIWAVWQYEWKSTIG